MEALDWLVIGVFFLALIGIIVWVVRQNKMIGRLFLGRTRRNMACDRCSIFASNIGSEHLIGLAGAGASSGMAMAHWEIQGWDDLDSGMGICTLLHTKHGIYNAGISGASL